MSSSFSLLKKCNNNSLVCLFACLFAFQMAFQPVVSKSPCIDFEAMEVTSQDVQSRFSLLLKCFRKTLVCITYILFFAWQVIGYGSVLHPRF